MKTQKKAVLVGGMLLAALFAGNASANEISSSARIKAEGRAELRQNEIKRPNIDDDKNDDQKIKINMDTIKTALNTNDYALFTKTITDGGFKGTVSQTEFNTMVLAYNKAKTGDIQGAQLIIKDAKLNPLLIRFIMNQHLELTDAQKTAIKQASEQAKQGKLEEAKAILKAAGLPDVMPTAKIDKNADLKIALEKSKQLRKDGKIEEAKQVLIDAGITDKALTKINKEFDKENNVKQKSKFMQKIKNFFRFGKNK